MKIKAIIFDYDGVIHDSFGFHHQKINEFSGASITEDEFREVHNGNFFQNTNNKLKDIDWLKYRDFIYQSQTNLETKGDIKNTLIALSKTHKLFIISSGGTRNISLYLKNNGLLDAFTEVLGADSHTRSKVYRFNLIFDKYSVTPKECMFITDTLGDILEANKVNVKTIAVDFGYHPRETLQKGKPFRIISNLNEILDIIENPDILWDYRG